MPWMMAAGALAKGITGGITALKQKHAANGIHPTDVDYSISPYARQRLALAQQSYNARGAGAVNAERNIAATQANLNANTQRMAADSSSALAMAAAGQAQANDAYTNLAAGEDQLKLQQQQMLAGAQDNMTNEGDKVYQDKVRKFDNARKEKAALLAASQQNASSAVGSIAGAMGSIGGMMSGGGGGDVGGAGVTGYGGTRPMNFWGKFR